VSRALSDVQRRRLLALLMGELRSAYTTAIGDGVPVAAAIDDIERRRRRLRNADDAMDPIAELVADQVDAGDE
jgi:hypothetical protein